jgi:hypothetical protein
MVGRGFMSKENMDSKILVYNKLEAEMKAAIEEVQNKYQPLIDVAYAEAEAAVKAWIREGHKL